MSGLSILIATHNGSGVLRRTLDGYAALSNDDIPFELICVNNASKDDTQEILDSYKSRLNLNTMFERRPGKNRAMNTGLAAVKGDIIVMSDDDSIPHAGFLQAWKSAFEAMPETDLFGGSIVPLFDHKPAAWMLECEPRFEELYAQRQNIPAGPISPERIYGPNMAMRSKVVEAGLRFDESVGPDASRKKSYAMGSETAFLLSAVAAGFKTGFAPEPTVSHIVREAHITPEYINGRAYRMGRGTAFKHLSEGTLILRPRSAPFRMAGILKRNINGQIKQFRSYIGSEEQKFHARWDANFFRGYQEEVADRKAENFNSR